MWKNLTESERAPYKLLAEEDQLRYARVCTFPDALDGCIFICVQPHGYMILVRVLSKFCFDFSFCDRSVTNKVSRKVGRAAKERPDTTFSLSRCAHGVLTQFTIRKTLINHLKFRAILVSCFRNRRSCSRLPWASAI